MYDAIHSFDVVCDGSPVMNYAITKKLMKKCKEKLENLHLSRIIEIKTNEISQEVIYTCSYVYYPWHLIPTPSLAILLTGCIMTEVGIKC